MKEKKREVKRYHLHCSTHSCICFVLSFTATYLLSTEAATYKCFLVCLLVLKTFSKLSSERVPGECRHFRWLIWKVFIHGTFSFSLLYCYNAMDVYKNKYNTATNTKIIKIWVFRVDPIYCRYIDPAERVWYMTCQLTSDISTKEFHH